MNKHFLLENIGKYKYIVLRNAFSDGKEEEMYWLTNSNDKKEKLIWQDKSIFFPNFEISFEKERFAKQTKQYSIYRLLELKEDWKMLLYKILSRYKKKEDVPMKDVIANVYTEIKRQRSYKHHLIRLQINNEERLDMYGIFTRILFPIERIKGDITTLYYYDDKYIVIREFIHNRLYLVDCFTTLYRDILWNILKEENKYCNLHLTFVQQDSDYYKAVYLADEERIKIILDDNATEKDRAIAKGLR